MENNEVKNLLLLHGFFMYAKCQCAGYTEKYKTNDSTFKVIIKPNAKTFFLKRGGMVYYGGKYSNFESKFNEAIQQDIQA